MKTITLDKISIVKDYLSSDFNRENAETELHFCIDSIKENIILLTKLKEDPTDEMIDGGIYRLTGVLRYMEVLIREAETIRKEGGEA